MSAEYEGKDPLELAEQAEHDINSYQAKTGNARAGASYSSKSAWLVRRIVHSIGWVAFTLCQQLSLTVALQPSNPASMLP
jgi:hypothetical protein